MANEALAKQIAEDLLYFRSLALDNDLESLAYLLDVARREAESPTAPSNDVKAWVDRLLERGEHVSGGPSLLWPKEERL
jgi:hypothetical protein